MLIDQTKMRDAASAAAAVLRALANDNRLLLLCHLSQGEASVGEMESVLGIVQPTLSQQLGVMRRLRLVATRREGKQIFYRIDDPNVLVLLKTLYPLYCPTDETGDINHEH